MNEFTKYRDDGREGLKFYTDSDYFVRLWVEETTKQTEKRRRKVRYFVKSVNSNGYILFGMQYYQLLVLYICNVLRLQLTANPCSLCMDVSLT